MNLRRGPGRVGAMAEMLARDLLRRRAALGLIVILPLAFYGFSRTAGPYHLTAGGIGSAWAISVAALFAALSGRAVDERLVLDGYRPWELLAGRVATLAAFAIGLSGAVGALMLALSGTVNAVAFWLGMGVVAGVSVPFGLAVGAVVARELEGVLVLIGVTGIQVALPSSSAVVGAFPLGGAQRLLDRASYASFPVAPALERSVGWMVLFGVVAVVASRRRVGLLVARRAQPRLHRLLLAPVIGTLAGAGLMVSSVTGAAATPTPSQSGLGTRAGVAVYNQWSVCLSAAGVSPADETGRRSFFHGQRGLKITVGLDGPSFFVPDPPSPPLATPFNAEAVRLLKKGEAADSGCPGSRPTSRP